MEMTNIALQEANIPNYIPAESFNNKLTYKPSKETDFNAVMETLEHPAIVAEQPVKTKVDDGSSLSCSEPKIIAGLNTKECADNSKVLLCEESAVSEEQEKDSEPLIDTVEDLEAEPNKKQKKENTVQLLNPAVANKNAQNSNSFEPKPKKETQTIGELVYNPPSCKKKRYEPEFMAAEVLENKPETLFEEQLLQTAFIIDEEHHEYENGSYYEQFEDLVLPDSEVAKFAQDSNLELHIEPEPVTFRQDVALQSEKLVHNVWQEADLTPQLKESDIHNLQVKQPQVLSSEAKKLDDSLFGYEALEQELATIEQSDMCTYEKEAVEQDENGLDLTSLGGNFEPYATAQNIQELSQVKDGYYDAKTMKIVTKQIAFNIEKAIAEIENSQPVSIQMSLTPKELGTLVINFVVEEGKIAMLTIAASNQHTKELISKNMVMLQQELDKSGFEVKTVEIFDMGASNSGGSTESGQHENQERQQEAYEHLLQKSFKHEFAVNFSKRGEIA